MKRSQEFSQASTSHGAIPAAKKPRITPSDSPTAVVADTEAVVSEHGDAENGWTKVEKRKARKSRKGEGKLDVCVLYLSCKERHDLNYLQR